MNKKAIVPLVLGLGIGLLAVKFGVDAIRTAQASSENKATVTVIKAKQDINAFDEIQPNMIEAVEVAESRLILANERIGDIEKVVGRVSGKAIPRGAPVLVSMLAPEGTVPGILGRIKPGFRAVSVQIDEVNSASYQLRPGVFVDVTVVMDITTDARGARGRKETVSEVILQRIEVASVGYGTQNDVEKKMSRSKPAKSATLFVRKRDVPKLHLAQTRGKVALALRGENDDDASSVARATSDDLLGRPKEDTTNQDMLAQMFALMSRDKETPKPITASPPRRQAPVQPRGVLVFHHSSIEGDTDVIEQIVFENPTSTKLLSVRLGAPTRAGAAMLEESRSTGS